MDVGAGKSGKRGLLPEAIEEGGDGWISDSILGVLASDIVSNSSSMTHG